MIEDRNDPLETILWNGVDQLYRLVSTSMPIATLP